MFKYILLINYKSPKYDFIDENTQNNILHDFLL